jgi:hypothetical protein
LILGVLMIAALFVPLSKCSHGAKENDVPPPAKTGLQKIFPRDDPRTDYDYGVKRLAPSTYGALTLVAFGWPLAVALLGRRARGKRFVWLLYVLELLLCAGTIWWIYPLSDSARFLWGTYFVWVLVSTYAIAALLDLGTSLRGDARRPGIP